jgi:hypothetical protein
MSILKLALVAAALSSATHPTPKVALVNHADFIRQTLGGEGATQYFLRTVSIGKRDLATIQKISDFTPDDPDVPFYLGQGHGGAPVGVVLFQQIDTPHGPLEIGVAIGPDGAVTAADVTTATVETKPWVQEATAAGLMKVFVGVRGSDDARKALATFDRKLDGMSAYMSELIATAVGRGLVLYGTLYKGSAA